MDEFRRWREERAARRRQLAGHSLEPLPPVTRIERRRQRRVHPWSWRGWFEPPYVSPVHPEWDDPVGRRLRVGTWIAVAAHLALIPWFLWNPTLRWPSREAPKTYERTFAIVNAIPPVRGQGGTGLRPAQTAPATRKPAARPAPPAARPQPPAPKPKSTTTRKPAPTVDTKTSVPEAVAEKNNARAEPSRSASPPTPSRAATQRDVVEGPLLAGRGPVPGSEASIGGLEGVDFPYNYYLELIRTKIAAAWRVPEGLVAPGRRIEALVTFRVQRDGSVSQSRLEVPSGSRDYDEAASRAIIDARPFPPLPPAFGGAYLTIHFQFAYVGH